MAPRILIILIAMGADYSFELISIVHRVPQFIGHNEIFLGSVERERRLEIVMSSTCVIFWEIHHH